MKLLLMLMLKPQLLLLQVNHLLNQLVNQKMMMMMMMMMMMIVMILKRLQKVKGMLQLEMEAHEKFEWKEIEYSCYILL